MWEIHNTDQLLTFLYSIIFGVMLCLFYDIFRALRKTVIYSAIAIALQDIFFWIVVALSSFLFLLSRTNGEIRLYVIIGQAIGFMLSRISVSVVFLRLLCFIFKKINGAIRLILRLYNAFLSRLQGLFRRYGKYCKEIIEKRKKSCKKDLKNIV